MFSRKIKIRVAISSDSPQLLLWRNDALTRSNSLNPEKIALKDHELWFNNSINSDKRVIYIAEISAVGEEYISCGMCRFDAEQNGATAIVSINLDPNFRGQGLSLPILESSIEKFSQAKPQTRELRAEIKATNLASVTIFSKAGFKLETVENGVGKYSLLLG